VQQKTLVVKAGQTYKFSYPSNHPFLFSTTPNGTWGPDGIAGNSDDGVFFNTGVDEGTNEITITMPQSTPTTLYYYCGAHPNMGGQIIIKEQVSGSGGSGGGGGGGGSY
jgi:plastocyanin